MDILFYNCCSVIQEPGTLISLSIFFHERALALWHLFSLVCPSEGFAGEVLLPSVGYSIWGSSCHLEMKASVERLELYSCFPGHAIFLFLIDAISDFPRFFGIFFVLFVFFSELLCPFFSRTNQKVQKQVRQLLTFES